MQATQQLNRPPKNTQELVPYLEPGKEISALLNSPVDDQPYVIIWETDPRTGMDLKPLVIGYEQRGRQGVRFVFTAMGVSLMSDADFKTANFPAGHQPSGSN